MDKDVKITPEQLSKAMEADYQKLVQTGQRCSERGARWSGDLRQRRAGARCNGEILMDERKKHRGKGKRNSLKEVIQYIARRFDMCDYPKFIERGWPAQAPAGWPIGFRQRHFVKH